MPDNRNGGLKQRAFVVSQWLRSQPKTETELDAQLALMGRLIAEAALRDYPVFWPSVKYVGWGIFKSFFFSLKNPPKRPEEEEVFTTCKPV